MSRRISAENLVKRLESGIAVAKGVDGDFVYITVGDAKRILNMVKEYKELKKEPVKPIFSVSKGQYFCGHCKLGMGMGNFCPHCATPVDWKIDGGVSNEESVDVLRDDGSVACTLRVPANSGKRRRSKEP